MYDGILNDKIFANATYMIYFTYLILGERYALQNSCANLWVSSVWLFLRK